MRLWPALLVVALGAAVVAAPSGDARAATAAQAPVAVMPFKNLNGDAELDWLRVGIAETMISDLKKGGLSVVERDQLDAALAELTLQGELGADTSTAARVGKLVGARTVVVGGYQRAGKKVRITARFVTVETGVVNDTAKTTGALRNIFALQDRIVARLLGKKPPRRRPRRPKPRAKPQPDKPAKPPPTADDTFEAYRLFSLSLSTGSEAQRVQFLKKAIELDPDFSYALEDLEALQKRLRKYEKQGARANAQKAQRLMASLEDPKLTGEQKSLAATQVMGRLISTFRYRDLLEVAQRVYEMNLPPYYGTDPREMASYYIFNAHQMLKQHDLMLQAGERHLKEFPGSMYAVGVTTQMNVLIQQRTEAPDRKERYEEEMAEVDEDLQELADNERIKPEQRTQRRYYLESRRCTAASSAKLYERTLKDCRAFLRAWRDRAPDPNMLHVARRSIILAHAERGEFDDARRLVDRWMDEDPKSARKNGLHYLTNTWPRD